MICELPFHGHRGHVLVMSMHYQAYLVFAFPLQQQAGRPHHRRGLQRDARRVSGGPSRGACHCYRPLPLVAAAWRHTAARFPGPP